jgi:hypothetical protein
VATIAAAPFGPDDERERKRKERGGGSHRRDLRRDPHLADAGNLHCHRCRRSAAALRKKGEGRNERNELGFWDSAAVWGFDPAKRPDVRRMMRDGQDLPGWLQAQARKGILGPGPG